MIEITYDRKKHSFTATGHAKSGESGHDLVCAAATILVYTLASNVEQMCADHAKVRRPHIELADGEATISCSPIHGMDAITTLTFDIVCSGFDILAQNYPENVHYSVVG